MREVVVLGSASQVPTRERNHNGYLLRFDGAGFLFDPGEGTQRQMTLAGVSVSGITHICVTHFHGDHALGLPGIIQRLSLDDVAHEVVCHFPASGGEYFERLRHATPFWERAALAPAPLTREGRASVTPDGLEVSVARLEHRIECFGYRITEPDGRRMLPERLAAAGVSGPDVGRLLREGELTVHGRTVRVDEVSERRRGQAVAFVMDTRLCPGAGELAAGADLLICESTFRHDDVALAETYGHLTARQAGELARDAGARELLLTHFSRRYPYGEAERFREEAAAVFDGTIHLGTDLLRVPLPPRR